MSDALHANDQPVELVEYEGESHGFRRFETILDALEREVALYERSL
jgi:dipeptidyl aminopeptidase/acylaminoacyl peptidase